ncbi:MAG: hypothetical protein AB9Q21_10560 [Candidatus Reddybacter sp.]
MKTPNRLWLIILTLPGIVLLSSCSSTDNTHGTHSHVSGSVQSVYGGYGYPYYGYPYYDDDYYEDRAEYVEEQRKKRQERREERQENRPGTQPIRQNEVDGARLRDANIQARDRSRLRTSTGMGRPQMGGGMPRMPRGGGRRRR